jgi:hypothetical protein
MKISYNFSRFRSKRCSKKLWIEISSGMLEPHIEKVREIRTQHIVIIKQNGYYCIKVIVRVRKAEGRKHIA